MASISKDKKTGKWYCRVPYKDANGNYKTKTKKGFTTKREAELYASDMEVKLSEGVNPNRDQIVFADYYDEWVEVNKAPVVTLSTLKKFQYIGKLIREHFGDTRLMDVTRSNYQAFLNKRGKNRSRDTVEKTHFAIKACMQDALYDKLIDRDPTYKAKIIYDVEEQRTIKYWNVGEVTKLIDYFEELNHHVDMMFYLMATTGIRVGEAYGLAWDDIQGNQLSIKCGYNHSYKTFTEGKTKSSIRTIEIDDRTKTLLKKCKIQYKKQCPKFIFLDKKQQPAITYTGALKHLKKICRDLEVSELGPHAFRHSHCSYLLFSGVDIHFIAKRLGHSSVAETQRTYSHVLDEMNQRENKMTMEAISKLQAK